MIRFGMKAMLMLLLLAWMNACATKQPVAPAPATPPPEVQAEKAAATMPKLKIAVARFEDKTAYGRGRLGDSATDKLTSMLANTDAFIMVERAELTRVLNEQALTLSGVIQDEKAAEVGKILGVSALIFGSVSEFGVNTESTVYGLGAKKTQTARASVTLRAVDATSGEVLFAQEGVGEASTEATQVLGMGKYAGYDETLAGRALDAALGKLVGNIIDNMRKIEWAAKVAEDKDGRIIINAGRKSGLTVGMPLAVHEPSDIVLDPDSGKPILVPGAMKGRISITQMLGEDAAICEAVDGMGFEAGDVVKMCKP